MSVVKTPIICMEARGKILDLAIFTCFSSQEALWHLCLLLIKYGSAQFLCVLHFKKNSFAMEDSRMFTSYFYAVL